MLWWLLVTIGLVGGMVGSLVGLGGGIIVVPSLLFIGSYTSLLPSLTPQIAVGTSIIILSVTGLSSTLAYVKQKKVDYRAGLIFFIGSGPGAFIGALVNKHIALDLFYICFGFFIIMISMLLSVTKYLKPNQKQLGNVRIYESEDGVKHTYQFHPILAIFISFGVGILSGLFGIGGGSLMVPTMLILFRFPIAVAVATSMFLVFLSSIIGSVAHIQLGNVEWLWALALTPGAWFGGKLGAYLNQRLKDQIVIIIFRMLQIVVGVKLIFQGI